VRLAAVPLGGGPHTAQAATSAGRCWRGIRARRHRPCGETAAGHRRHGQARLPLSGRVRHRPRTV